MCQLRKLPHQRQLREIPLLVLPQNLALQGESCRLNQVSLVLPPKKVHVQIMPQYSRSRKQSMQLELKLQYLPLDQSVLL